MRDITNKDAIDGLVDGHLRREPTARPLLINAFAIFSCSWARCLPIMQCDVFDKEFRRVN